VTGETDAIQNEDNRGNAQLILSHPARTPPHLQKERGEHHTIFQYDLIVTWKKQIVPLQIYQYQVLPTQRQATTTASNMESRTKREN